MTVSFLVRLIPRALAESRIVGQVKAIATGATAPVRDADDLIAFLLASGQAGPRPEPEAGPRPEPGEGHPMGIGPDEEAGTPA